VLATVGCRGYRAFREPTNVHLSRLTVIFGKNNSGKTTLTRLPLFIRSAFGDPNFCALSDGDLRYGSSFRDIANFSDPHPSIDYWISTDDQSSWAVDLQSVSRELEEVVQVKRILFDGVETNFPLIGSTDTTPRTNLEIGILRAAAGLSEARQRLGDSMANSIHIPSARPHVLPVYEARPPTGASVDEAPYWLYKHHELAEVVSNWLTTMFDGMNLELEHSDYGFRLVTGRPGREVNFAATGRGSQSLMPVVTLLKAVALGLIETNLVIVEEPEAHLHPSAHTAMAELLAEASTHTQILTETHSENFILRLRRKIALGQMSSDSVRLNYVDDNHEVVQISIDETGSVDNWPIGLFEYDVEEARAIVEARLRNLPGQ
jgi:AAA ATPase domain